MPKTTQQIERMNSLSGRLKECREAIRRITEHQKNGTLRDRASAKRAENTLRYHRERYAILTQQKSNAS